MVHGVWRVLARFGAFWRDVALYGAFWRVIAKCGVGSDILIYLSNKYGWDLTELEQCLEFLKDTPQKRVFGCGWKWDRQLGVLHDFVDQIDEIKPNLRWAYDNHSPFFTHEVTCLLDTWPIRIKEPSHVWVCFPSWFRLGAKHYTSNQSCGALWRVVARCGALWRVVARFGVFWRVVCGAWRGCGGAGPYPEET